MNHLLLRFLLFFAFSCAWEVFASSKSLNIEWYEPELESPEAQGKVRFNISGETLPRARVSIDYGKIIVIRGKKEGKASKLPPEVQSTDSDESGSFELSLKMPVGLLQVPVVVQKFREQQTFLLLFDIGEKSVKINAKVKRKPKKREAPVLAEKPKPPPPSVPSAHSEARSPAPSQNSNKDYFISFGLGGTYQKLGQRQENVTDVAFQNLKTPSFNFQAGMDSNKMGIRFSYIDGPGAVTQAAAPLFITNGNYHWTIAALEGLWRMGDRVKDNASKFRFGLQSQQIPFLSILQPSNEVIITNNSLLGISLGYGTTFGESDGWQTEVYFNYVYPVSYQSSTLNSFSLLPKLGLEGSVGVFKRRSKWTWGFYWLGQLQSHSFTYKDSTTPTTIYNGDISFMFSDFSVRFGYGF